MKKYLEKNTGNIIEGELIKWVYGSYKFLRKGYGNSMIYLTKRHFKSEFTEVPEKEPPFTNLKKNTYLGVQSPMVRTRTLRILTPYEKGSAGWIGGKDINKLIKKN